MCRSPFFDEIASHRSATLLRKILQYWRFLMNFIKFLRISFAEHIRMNISTDSHLLCLLKVDPLQTSNFSTKLTNGFLVSIGFAKLKIIWT